MKWSHIEMANWPNGKKEYEESVEFAADTFRKNDRLRDLKDVKISGSAFYDSLQEHLYVESHISGIMIVPDSLTLENVDYPFSITDEETYSFLPLEDDEDAVEVKGEIVDTLPEIFGAIMAEIPWVVHKDKNVVYPKGDGWMVTSEADESKQEKGIDPRLAKILEYKPTEEN